MWKLRVAPKLFKMQYIKHDFRIITINLFILSLIFWPFSVMIHITFILNTYVSQIGARWFLNYWPDVVWAIFIQISLVWLFVNIFLFLQWNNVDIWNFWTQYIHRQVPLSYHLITWDGHSARRRRSCRLVRPR